jgi:hypothetical protein
MLCKSRSDLNSFVNGACSSRLSSDPGSSPSIEYQAELADLRSCQQV